MHDSPLDAVVLNVLVCILPSIVTAKTLGARSAGNNDRLIEELKRGDCITLVLQNLRS